MPLVPTTIRFAPEAMELIEHAAQQMGTSVAQFVRAAVGDRLTLTAGSGVVVARRDPHGMVIVPTRYSIAIPATLRHRCGLRPGDQVLLATAPGQDTLIAYTFAVVDQALRAHAPLPHGEGGRS